MSGLSEAGADHAMAAHPKANDRGGASTLVDSGGKAEQPVQCPCGGACTVNRSTQAMPIADRVNTE